MGSPAGPLRSCVGCRAVVPATDLLRFVLDGGRLRLDESGSAPGRGAWLHPDPECFRRARRHGGFARSFRARVDDSVLDELPGAADPG